VTPAADLLVGGTEQLTATTEDAEGQVLSGRALAWSSSDPLVASISATGLLTAISAGAATITATSERVSSSDTVAVIRLVFAAVSAGDHRTCGVTAAGIAACWGNNVLGGLGDGSATDQSSPVLVAGGPRLAMVTAAGGEQFEPGDHVCGVTTAGAAYCWGLNSFGQLGDRTTAGPEQCMAGIPCSPTPVPVLGGLVFTMASANHLHTCAVTSQGAAYCWGFQRGGELGNGIAGTFPIPVAVGGGVAFASVTAGHYHTCGLTTDGAAYCWGLNANGEIGDGSAYSQDVPVRVAGGLSFTELSAGYYHTCAVTATGAAYCWGFNGNGELGDGTMADRSTPALVSGGLSFSAVSAGTYHTCGLTAGGAAYCWGFNGNGELGDGTNTNRSTPAPVAGSISFLGISSGNSHTCGLTAAGAANCWGDNSTGQLGDGTTTNRLTPTPVVQ
jgi:alpha-tubulin suppressor-like RCC1 family protein